MFTIQSRVSALAFLAVGVCFVLASSAAQAATPMYRFHRATTGEHFYTATFSEGVNAGFKSEGIGFRFYSSSGIGRIAIYRCIGAGWHFISTLSNCEGATHRGWRSLLHDRRRRGGGYPGTRICVRVRCRLRAGCREHERHGHMQRHH